MLGEDGGVVRNTGAGELGQLKSVKRGWAGGEDVLEQGSWRGGRRRHGCADLRYTVDEVMRSEW